MKYQPEPLLLTLAETQVILKVSLPVLRRMIRDGRIPAIRIGRAIRVPAAGVRAFIEAETEAARNS